MDAAEHVSIPEGELVCKASRSSGPGGQNVNKLNTRVTVLFHVAGSVSLSEEQKRQVASRLAGRIDKEGVLHVASQKHRSQEANRRAALERLAGLVEAALKLRKARRPTAPTAASRARRVESKKRRAVVKRTRTRPDLGE